MTSQPFTEDEHPINAQEFEAQIVIGRMESEVEGTSHRPCTPPNVHLVANEIWMNVFDCYSALWCTFRAVAPEASALVLGQVCRRWRRLALSMPQLWNHPPIIHITRESREGEYVKDGWEELFLRRSGNFPLKLHLSFEIPPNEIPYRPYSILKPFLDRSTRWEHLTVSGLMVPQTQIQLGSVHKNLPCLRSLTLNFVETTFHFVPNTKFDAFEFAPNLTKINIHSTTPSGRKCHTIFPWHQLTNFKQTSIDITTFPWMLKTGDLETLCYKGRNIPYHLKDPVSHFKLRHLAVELQKVSQFWRYLQDMTLPALETLSVRVLSSAHQQHPPQISTLADLVLRSSCPLKNLVLDFHTTRIDPVGVKALLSHTSDLESLELGDCYGPEFCEHVLSSLVFKRDQTTILPRLRCLTLNLCKGFDWLTDFVVSKLVESREKEVMGDNFPGQLFAPLEHVRVVTLQVYDRYRFMHHIGGWEDPLKESRFHGPDNDSPPFVIETDALLLLTRNIPNPSEDEPTPELFALFTLLHLRVGDIRLRQEVASRLGKLAVLSTLQAHMLQRRWIPGCKEDILYIHPDHYNVSEPGLWEALMSADLKRLGSLIGYNFMEEREDDLMDVDLMDGYDSGSDDDDS